MTHNYEDKEIFDVKVREFMRREGWDKLSKEELAVKVSETLNELIEQGLVEQLVGEDGEFYYRSISR